MKTLLDQGDIQSIASALLDMLKPVLASNGTQIGIGNGKEPGMDTVFDKQGLSAYLKVSVSTVNKMISNKELPYFKIQAGQSGGVRFCKRDIDRWIQRQTVPAIDFRSKAR